MLYSFLPLSSFLLPLFFVIFLISSTYRSVHTCLPCPTLVLPKKPCFSRETPYFYYSSSFTSGSIAPTPAPADFLYIADGSCRDDKGGHGYWRNYAGQTKEQCEDKCTADPTCHSISWGQGGSCHPHCTQSTAMCTNSANSLPVNTPTTGSIEGDLKCYLSPFGQGSASTESPSAGA